MLRMIPIDACKWPSAASCDTMLNDTFERNKLYPGGGLDKVIDSRRGSEENRVILPAS